MTEADLEDYIFIKAIRDYNTCKFAHIDHHHIDSILKDVFVDKLANWNISLNGPNIINQQQGYSNLKDLVV